jgi:organic radical activating enzyme
MKGKISEIFVSVQGEGLYLGERQLFIRFFGCNLGCKFCDTKFNSFKEYSLQELFKELESQPNGYHTVAFTGGEPLLQKDFLKEVLKETRKRNFKNYLETNGTLPEALREVIDYVDVVAMDFKLPTSTMTGDWWQAHRRFLEVISQKEFFLKTVICESTEEEDLQEGISLIKEVNDSAILVLQANSFEEYNRLKDKLANFKETCIKNSVAAFVIPQMHKLMGLR